MKNRLAIFASGSGTNADAILTYFKKNKAGAVSLIVTNRADAGVIGVAKKHSVPFIVINRDQLNDTCFLLEELKKYEISHIILAGFLLMIPSFLVKEFRNKMINIHPALLPEFGGKGMYGKRVHEAVLHSGNKKSGITIHFVTEEYDKGKIIFQEEVILSPNETVESLEEKVHQLEHKYYPVIIDKLINDEL